MRSPPRSRRRSSSSRPRSRSAGGSPTGSTASPRRPSIRQDFVKFNADMQRMAAFTAKSGFVRKAPQAIASRAHGVLALRTADGPVYLWAAPRRGGGICWLVQLGSSSSASCDETWPPDRRLSFSTSALSAIRRRAVRLRTGARRRGERRRRPVRRRDDEAARRRGPLHGRVPQACAPARGRGVRRVRQARRRVRDARRRDRRSSRLRSGARSHASARAARRIRCRCGIGSSAI